MKPITASFLLSQPASLMLWLPALVGLQGVPHTGALRTLMLLIGIAHLLWLSLSNGPLQTNKLPRSEQIVFWLLGIWLLIQSGLFAQNPIAAYTALLDDWGKLVLMTLVGVWLAKIISQSTWLLIGLFSGAFLHVLSVLGFQFYALMRGGEIIFQGSFLSEYPIASYFSLTAFIWLAADCVSRHWHKRALFPWPIWVSITLAVLALAAETLLKAKSGQVMLVVTAVITGFVALARPGKNHYRWLLAGIVLLSSLTGVVLKIGGDRWGELGDSLYAARHGQIHLDTLVTEEAPIPENVNHSFYMRAIRGIKGIEGILEHPLGIGYGPDVFNRYINARLGVKDAINSSNSGLVDFGLAVGIPGLFLLLLLCTSLVWRGWRSFINGQPAGLVLVLLVVHQLGRYTLDGTLGGSRFTGHALVIGALWALSSTKASK